MDLVAFVCSQLVKVSSDFAKGSKHGAKRPGAEPCIHDARFISVVHGLHSRGVDRTMPKGLAPCYVTTAPDLLTPLGRPRGCATHGRRQ
jgi:hypothetical protein